MFNYLLLMMLAGDSGKGHQQAVGFCVHPGRLTHKAGGSDADNGSKKYQNQTQTDRNQSDIGKILCCLYLFEE
ncbi:MAG: hypothetical protein PHG38_09750 [Bacteroidales bacterium]|nr:hypothetical protein [Bacteroidales bacterium]